MKRSALSGLMPWNVSRRISSNTARDNQTVEPELFFITHIIHNLLMKSSRVASRVCYASLEINASLCAGRTASVTPERLQHLISLPFVGVLFFPHQLLNTHALIHYYLNINIEVTGVTGVTKLISLANFCYAYHNTTRNTRNTELYKD